MTVFDNIAFGLTVRPRSRRPARAEIRARGGELLDLVQLAGLGERYPGAAFRRPAPARRAGPRAWRSSRGCCCSTSPSARSTPRSGKELRRWLREMHDQTGHTTVFVTHDQEEALELADRVVVMSQGGIEQVGTPDEIYDRPNSPFVFGFVGETNSFPVTIEDGRPFFAGRALDLAVESVAGGDRVLAFRPHDVVVSAAPGAITGHVVAERRRGGVHRLEVETGRDGHRVEIDVAAHEARPCRGEPIGILPLRWWPFDPDERR